MPIDISEEAIRLQHLENIRSAGIEPYPAHTKRTHTLSEAREAGTDSEVIVAGRIVSKREMGKIAFCHLKDMSGRLQAVFSANQLDPEKYKFFIKQFDLGDFVSVRGKIFVTKAGEVSVMVDEFDILTKTLLPLPEKFHGLSDIEVRESAQSFSTRDSQFFRRSWFLRSRNPGPANSLRWRPRAAV